jgi:histidinol-phosphate aminotransferase
MLGAISGLDLVSMPDLEPLYNRLTRFLGTDRRRLLVCPGSGAGIQLVFQARVRRWDGVVLTEPTYHRYRGFCRMRSATRIVVRYSPSLSLDLELLLATIAPPVRLVVAVNPNDATGTAIELPDLARLAERARACGALLLVDEAFHHYCDVTALPLLDDFENVVVTRTFSKAFGLAAARLGVVITAPALVDELRSRMPRDGVSGISARCGEYVLDHSSVMTEHVEMVRASRSRLADALAGSAWTMMPSQSSSVLVRLPEGVESVGLAARLAGVTSCEVEVPLRPPLDRYLRVALAPWPRMLSLVEALRG